MVLRKKRQSVRNDFDSQITMKPRISHQRVNRSAPKSPHPKGNRPDAEAEPGGCSTTSPAKLIKTKVQAQTQIRDNLQQSRVTSPCVPLQRGNHSAPKNPPSKGDRPGAKAGPGGCSQLSLPPPDVFPSDDKATDQTPPGGFHGGIHRGRWRVFSAAV